MQGHKGFAGAKLKLLLASSSIAALMIGEGAPAAYAACINGGGGYDNPVAATVAGICVTNTSFSGNITNEGTIGTSGISFTNHATMAGQISSTGTINGGITLDSTSGINSSHTGIVLSGPTFTGGINNAGMIIANNDGILAGANVGSNTSITIATFGGGITNAGMITATNGSGIVVGGSANGFNSSVTVSAFSGNISNSGTITAAQNGIVVGGEAHATIASATVTVSTFAGSVINSGTISAQQNGIQIGGTALFFAATVNFGTMTGGITNSGVISAGAAGVIIENAASVGGGIVNFGTISGAAAGVNVVSISTFAGGISNSGAILSAGSGIAVSAISSFTGNVSNSGTISGHVSGVTVANISLFSGNIANSGTIASATRGGLGVTGITTFDGSITNTGMISGGGLAINVAGISVFTGSITNAGTIHGGLSGIGMVAMSTFAGGLTNSGLISGGAGVGVGILFSSTIVGSISNAGTITAGAVGIFIDGVTSVPGGITNSGAIIGRYGIFVTNSGAISVYDSGTIVGTGGTAVDLSANAVGSSFTLTPSASISGLVVGRNGDALQLGGTGAGTFNLSNVSTATSGAGGPQYQGFDNFNVVSGNWTATGTFSGTQAWNVLGGTFAGAATLSSVNVGSGATLAPGTPGVAGTVMTINGNLAFQSGAIYLVTLNGTSASRANVSGAVSLNGTVDVLLTPGSFAGKTPYNILDPTSISGRFTNLDILNAPGISGSLSYTSDAVFLTLTASINTSGLNTNQQNVANAINAGFNNGGTLPAGLFPLLTGAGGNFGSVFTQVDGEAATGAEQGAFRLTTEFLNLMLDPFVNGRGYGPGGSGASASGGALGFAPDQTSSLPPDVALAYASILGKAPPTNFAQRWNTWGTAFGGAENARGDAGVGSHDISSGAYGFAAGMDYKVSPSTVVGFALAGAGTSWGLASGLGGGYSDALQVGTYGISWYGPAYLSGALSFTNHWFTTNRSALGDQLSANFAGQSYGARFEGGYRLPVWRTFGVTPYGALQAQEFQTPSYSESDASGGGVGLAYNAMNASDVRTELGARFDDPTLLFGRPLILFGRAAWAHDFVSNPALSAAFETMPGATFTVNGAPIPHDSALTTAGAQFFLASNWSVIAKFDGEFAQSAQTYGGSGTLRYSW